MSDPANPSGALPGDPRYGLSEEELKQYYRTKAPSWCIRSVLDPDGGTQRRDANIDPHMEFLREQRGVIRFSGPLIAEDGSAVGGLCLIDAPDRAAAQAWIDSEPFCKAGVFNDTTITRWSSSMEIRQADYPRTEGWQQFAITALDGPEADARRAAVAPDHHKFQASVMDRYVARGPLQNDDGVGLRGSFMIMEYPDRAACEDFWTKEPLNYGGVFADVTIERWRYGKSLG